MGIVNQKPSKLKCFLKKDFVVLHASQRKDQLLGMQSEPPVAGLDGEDTMSMVLGLQGSFIQ